MILALKAAVSAFARILTLRMVPGLATVNIDSLVPCWQSHNVMWYLLLVKSPRVAVLAL